MKKQFLFFALLLANQITVSVMAQNTNQLYHGSLGGVYPVGITLPGNVAMPSGYLSIGSGGYGRLKGRFLIGGSGFGAIERQTNASFGEISTDFGMGFLDLGYTLREKEKSFHYVFAGIGGGGISVNYRNTAEPTLRLSSDLTLDPGQQARLSSGGIFWQAGISLNRLFFNADEYSGGLKIGLDLGLFHAPYMTGWRHRETGNRLDGLGRPGIQGIFTRITIGGAW